MSVVAVSSPFSFEQTADYWNVYRLVDNVAATQPLPDHATGRRGVDTVKRGTRKRGGRSSTKAKERSSTQNGVGFRVGRARTCLELGKTCSTTIRAYLRERRRMRGFSLTVQVGAVVASRTGRLRKCTRRWLLMLFLILLLVWLLVGVLLIFVVVNSVEKYRRVWPEGEEIWRRREKWHARSTSLNKYEGPMMQSEHACISSGRCYSFFGFTPPSCDRVDVHLRRIPRETDTAA